MLEKRFIAIAPQVFTANGDANGTITIADTSLFKVGQRVIVNATGLFTLDTLEVKRILSSTTLIVGPQSGAINTFTNLSAYTVILGSNILANEQFRPIIIADDFERAVYEEEPAVAKRTILVDEFGNKITASNPLPTSATFSGSISIGTVSQGTPADDVNAWPIKIISDNSVPGLICDYNEIISVASSVETTLLTVSVVTSHRRFFKIEVSGDTVALFRVKLDGTTIISKRNNSTDFNITFNFENFANGLFLTNGQILTVTVYQMSSSMNSFEATAMSI